MPLSANVHHGYNVNNTGNVSRICETEPQVLLPEFILILSENKMKQSIQHISDSSPQQSVSLSQMTAKTRAWSKK